MAVIKKVNSSSSFEQLIDQIGQVQGILFVAYEIDGHGDYERHLTDLRDVIQEMRQQAKGLPEAYTKSREFTIYLIGINNEISDQIARLDFDSRGHWYTREELCGSYLSSFSDKHHAELLRYRSEFQYETSLYFHQPPAIDSEEQPNTRLHRHVLARRMVVRHYLEHLDLLDVPGIKDAKGVTAAPLQSAFKRRFTRGEVEKFIVTRKTMNSDLKAVRGTVGFENLLDELGPQVIAEIQHEFNIKNLLGGNQQ